MNLTPVFKYIFFILITLPNALFGALPSISQAEIIERTICEGDCIVVEGGTYCEEGAYPIDNGRTLKVNVLPRIQFIDQTICEGETFPGQDWSTPGNYSYQTLMGECEITVNVNLKVAQHKEIYLEQQIEYGACYDFGPNTFCQSGQYELRYLTSEGCDSTIFINLIVEELLIDTLPALTVCAGESYIPNGIDTVLTQSGLYEFFGTNSAGRTTLTILDFRIKNAIITELEESTCDGQSFSYIGQEISETGIYEFNYTSRDGCDSLVRLNLTIGESIITELTRTINPNQGVIIGQNVVNLEGNYEFIFLTEQGCDSLVILELIINGESDSIFVDDPALAEDLCSGIINRTICPSELPYKIGQNTFWQGGNFDFVYPAPDGCSNDVQLVLNIDQKITRLKERICEGTSYMMNNNSYEATGIYIDTIFSNTNTLCDSIIILNLTVESNKDTIVHRSICWGTPFISNGTFVTESGEYTEMFQTDTGCDSVVTTLLTIIGNPDEGTQNLTLCAGDSYADDIGNKVFVSGLYTFNFQSSGGCDSTVVLDLLIPDTIRSSVDTFFCDGETFNFENFAVTRAGTYRERFFSTNGCDSLVQYNLTTLDCEINALQDADSIICGGNTGEFSFILIKGQAPFSYEWTSNDGVWSGAGENLNLQEEVLEEGLPGGIFSVTVTDVNGKEAYLEIELFRPEIITAEWLLPEEIDGTTINCHGDSSAFLEIMPAGGLPPFRYNWSNGITNTARIENLPAGNYTVTVTDALNCPYVDSRTLNEPPKLSFEAAKQNPICEDFFSGRISVNSTLGGVPPYEYRLDGFTNFSESSDFQNLPAGTYVLQLMDAAGCQRDTNFTLTEPEILELTAETEFLIDLGESIPIEVISSHIPQTVQWETVDGLSCYDCLDLIANPIKNSLFTLTATSIDDCETRLQIRVNVSKERYIFAPNVFSHNTDGLNDQFTLFSNQGVDKIDLLQIYSRWGELLFETKNILTNEEYQGWDGYHNGRKMNPGVYVWVANVRFIDGEVKNFSGDLVLVK